jgi:hypothetical protein
MLEPPPPDPTEQALRRAWRALDGPPPTFWRVRAWFLRGLAAVYAVAFGSWAWQVVPLVGERGLLPATHFLERVAGAYPDYPWTRLPTLFWLDCSDGALLALPVLGTALALGIVATGRGNAFLFAALWGLYLSVQGTAQDWFGYGWESQLLETGFLAIFLAPPVRTSWWHPDDPPPEPVIWLLRWLMFRIMLGAGLIKLRGDPCWWDLTCLERFYETQPNPNPLSWYLHFSPRWFLHAGVLLNHLVEIVGPFLLFGPRKVRVAGGVLQIAFQGLLIVGGNLSFLNWLTALPALASLDDRFLSYVPTPPGEPLSQLRRSVALSVAALVGARSFTPVVNLLSNDQVMNTSYDPLQLVNTYGAFGSVTEVRDVLTIEGTSDDPADPAAAWREYELPCATGDPDRRPCIVTPWQWRIDWQIWFAAMESVDQNPWLVHLSYELLSGDREIRRMFAVDPFDGAAPRAIRIRHWRYHFARPGAGTWWTRELVGPWLPALEVNDPRWNDILDQYGWPVASPDAR